MLPTYFEELPDIPMMPSNTLPASDLISVGHFTSTEWPSSGASNVFTNTCAVLALCNPFLIGIAQFKAYAVEGSATLFREWQNFATYRLTADMRLMQQLVKCKSLDQITAAYADFSQKAFTDYTKEFRT
jgi:hypothetical protein